MSYQTDEEKDYEKLVKIAEQEQKIAESKAKVAEAELKALETQLPGEAKGLEGKITTDKDAGYLAELTAYSAMLSLIDDIAENQINKKLTKKSTTLLVDSLDIVAGDVNMLQLQTQIKDWKTELEIQEISLKKEINQLPKHGALPAADVGVMAGGLLFMKTAADIASLLQLNYDVKGKKIAMEALPLKLRMIDKIDGQGRLPTFYKMQTPPPILEDIEICINLIKSLSQKKLVLSASINDSKKLNTITAGADSVIKGFDTFLAQISTAPKDDYSPLVKAALRQDYERLGITHFLYIEVTSAGGESIAAQGWFITGRMAFLGGGIVSYLLSDIDGNILASGAKGCDEYVKFNLRNETPPNFKW